MKQGQTLSYCSQATELPIGLHAYPKSGNFLIISIILTIPAEFVYAAMDHKVQARIFVLHIVYLTGHYLIRYEQRISVEPDLLQINGTL